MATPDDISLPSAENAEWVNVIADAAVTASDAALFRNRDHSEPGYLRTSARAEMNNLFGVRLRELGFGFKKEQGQIQWVADPQVHGKRFRLLITTGKLVRRAKRKLLKFRIPSKGPVTERAIEGNIPFLRDYRLDLFPFMPYPSEQDLPTFHLILDLSRKGLMSLYLAFASPPYQGEAYLLCEDYRLLRSIRLREPVQEKAATPGQIDVDIREKDGSGG